MVEFNGIYNVNSQFKVIYLPPTIFYKLLYSIKAGKKVFFVTVDDREQLITPQQIKYWIPQQGQNGQQYFLIPFRIEPYFFYTDRVSIEEFSNRIVFRDLKTIPTWAILNSQENSLELPEKPEVAPGVVVEFKAPRRGRKAFLEAWEG